MGHGRAKSVVEKGRSFTVPAHRRREAVEDLIGRSIREARNARELAETFDVAAEADGLPSREWA